MLDELFTTIIERQTTGIISIDGFCGSGKTHIGRHISEQMKIPHLDTDKYIDESLKGAGFYYPDQVNYENLKNDINKLITENELIVISGICIDETLNKIKHKSSFKVYVKRISAENIWHDYFGLEDFKADESQNIPQPHRSAFQYHLINTPHEQADYTYSRQCDS